MSRLRRRLLTMMSGGGYASYIQSLQQAVWLRFRETSGNPVNSGTLALSITQAAATQGVTGAKQAAEAYDFDGAAASGSLVTIANDSTLKAWTTQRWAFLCHPDTLGGNTQGKLGVWGGFGATDHLLCTMVSSNRLQATINTNTTNANAVTNVNQISDCIGAWAWLFMDFDEANALGNGRKIRLFKGLNGVVTQLTLATDTAAVGTVDQPATGLIIGNRSSRDHTFDGPIDEVIGNNSLWTAAEMQTITNFFV